MCLVLLGLVSVDALRSGSSRVEAGGAAFRVWSGNPRIEARLDTLHEGELP